MIKNTEIEFKLLVNKQCLDDLAKSFDNINTIDQTNHYYISNTQNLLEKNVSIRIREINNSFTFTLKHKEIDVTEYECAVNSLDIEVFKMSQIEKVLSKFKIENDLIKQGSLRTIRKLIDTQYGELCLDENYYNNQIDYEIEFELYKGVDKSVAFAYFNDILNKHNITFIENKISKQHRFYNTLCNK